MNNMFDLSESIRTIASDKLQRNISLKRMHGTLIDLFCDRTEIETSLRRFFNEDDMQKSMQYSRCQSLNDERTIKFNQSFKQQDDVFDETRQIWIDRFIDPIKDDLFMPRDDAND